MSYGHQNMLTIKIFNKLSFLTINNNSKNNTNELLCQKLRFFIGSLFKEYGHLKLLILTILI